MKLASTRHLKRYIFPVILFIAFMILVAMQLNGSSIGIYWYYLNGEVTSDPDLLLGSPRAIRSDEYKVETPWTVMESRIDFSEHNPFIGSGQNLIMTDVPIRHWSLIFSPQNWGYFFLPLEYAFSFQWWFKGLLLILGVYLLATILFDNYLISAIIALSALYSPVIQWWYSTSLVLTFAYFFIILFLFIQIIRCETSRKRLFLGGMLTYSIACFMFLSYVPALISAVLALLFLAIGLLLTQFTPNENQWSFRSKWTNRIKLWFKQLWTQTPFKSVFAVFLIALLVNLVILLIFFIDEQQLFDSMLNSAYPGYRRESGGAMLATQLLGGFYNIQLLSDSDYYLGFANQCEASSFFMLSIFLLPFLVFHQIKKITNNQRPDFFLLSIIAFYILALCWALIGLPKPIARALLLDRVPANRMILILGAINLLLILYFLSTKPFRQTRNYQLLTVLYATAVALFYFIVGYKIQLDHPGFFFSSLIIYIVPIFVFLLLFTLLNYSKFIFSITLLAFSILTSFYVNPLYRGLAVIQDTRIAQTVQRIANEPKNQEVLWAVYDSNFANYISANGARVFNALQYHPQPDLWKNIDPYGKFSEIYNRYAHIQMILPVGNEIDISLERVDGILIRINPCDPALEKTNVHLFVFHQPVSYSCLDPIETVIYPHQSFYIYQRK